MDATPLSNYGKTKKGLGEAHGALSTGFDGGGYGQILPWLSLRFALLTALDANTTATQRSNIVASANATVDAFNQILSPMDNATISGGNVTANAFNFSEETFITYRDTKNPQTTSGRFNFNAQFLASDPAGVMTNAPTHSQARRSASQRHQPGQRHGVLPHDLSASARRSLLEQFAASRGPCGKGSAGCRFGFRHPAKVFW